MLILQVKLLMLLMMFKKLDRIRKELSIKQRLTEIQLSPKQEVKLKKFFKRQKVIKTSSSNKPKVKQVDLHKF